MRPLLLLLATALPVAAQIPAAEFADRRARLLRALPNDAVVVALGAPEPARDYEHFHQASSFRYLTGFREPEAALVLVRHAGTTAGLLFVAPRDPAREVWTGPRLGVAAVREATGLEGRDHATLDAVLDSVMTATRLPVMIVGDVQDGRARLTADDQFVAAFRRRHPGVAVTSANALVSRLRAYKSPAEVTAIRRAVDITTAAHREALGAVRPGAFEYEVQARIEAAFRRRGAERPSFATIVGSGPMATVLHYNANDRRMADGDVVVMDIGASYDGYAADVTRTVPVNGRYTAEQRAVYQVVRDAQRAAERQIRPGGRARAMSDSAAATLAAGLARLGLIESPTATYDCDATGERQCPQLGLYYLHGLGHGIGLDVHDPDRYYFEQALGEGSVFTVEPGVYVRAELPALLPRTPRNARLAERLAPIVSRYAHIGVRIEDDYLVTKDGYEWLSRAPREIDEVERLMAARVVP
jgi:Xaa-Pro aminopeptidase